MQSRSLFLAAALAAGTLALSLVPAPAQQHRATRLGHPSTRFAPPLTRPEQLRALLLDEKMKPDVVAILQQAGWKGDVEDLRRAADTVEITEVKLPKGYRMPFMSSRKDGKPEALIDVLWAGDKPIEAYTFPFASKGRRYRCVTPKPCSNFFVEDLGAEPPSLQLVKTAPADASLCAPFDLKISVRNTCSAPLTQVRVTDALPSGLRSAEGQAALSFDAGTLAPGAAREFVFKVVATAAGNFASTAQAVSAQGARGEAPARTAVHAPALAIECNAPGEVIAGRPLELCLTVKNTGDAAEPKAEITLPIPEGASVTSTTEGGVAADGRITWTLADFAPQASNRVCAVMTARQPGFVEFAPTAHGACAPPVTSQCTTKVNGVAGVLVEVVDLEDPIEVDKQVTYEIRVTNQGDVTLTNIKLGCTVPEEQEYVSGSGITAVSAQGRAVTMEVLPMLRGKGVESWRVVTKAVKPGDSRFKISMTADQFPQPVERTESTYLY